jgi:hypothetical protein
MSDEQNVSEQQANNPDMTPDLQKNDMTPDEAVADEQQTLDERQEATGIHETAQEPAVGSPAAAPSEGDPATPQTAPVASVQAETTPAEVPETVAKLYDGVRVVTLTGGANVVMAQSSVLSNHEEQRISGEHPTVAAALEDAERIAKLQVDQQKDSGAVVGDELKDEDGDSDADVADEDDSDVVDEGETEGENTEPNEVENAAQDDTQ